MPLGYNILEKTLALMSKSSGQCFSASAMPPLTHLNSYQGCKKKIVHPVQLSQELQSNVFLHN